MQKKKYTYEIILAVTILILLLSIIYISYLREILVIPKCIIYEKFGIYCLGCGCTRAVYSLYNGNILKSIYYNPLIVYIILIVLGYLITEGIAKITKKENKIMTKNINVYIFIGLALLIINWIVKLIMAYKGIPM